MKYYMTPAERLMGSPRFLKNTTKLYYRAMLSSGARQMGDSMREFAKDKTFGLTREEKLAIVKDTRRFYNVAFDEVITEIKEAK